MMKLMRSATLPIRRLLMYVIGFIGGVLYPLFHADRLEEYLEVYTWSKYYGDNSILGEYIMRNSPKMVKIIQFCDLEYPNIWDEYLES